MRVLGGKFRGRLLRSPSTDQTRPTTSKLRKALFDICQSEIEGTRVLDLYAGCGAIGIEALSRGASHVTFVDAHRLAVKRIYENLHLLQLEAQAEVRLGDAMQQLKRLQQEGFCFDLVYIDPPYALGGDAPRGLLVRLLEWFDGSSILQQGASLFLEEGPPHRLNTSLPQLARLSKTSVRRFGRTLLHQFRVLH